MREVNLIAVVVPVAVAAGVEMPRWRVAGKSQPVSCSAQSLLAGRATSSGGTGGSTVRLMDWLVRSVGVNGCSQTRCPPVTTIGRIGRPRRLRKVEGPRLKCDFDPEDRTLREQENAFSGLDRSAGRREGASVLSRSGARAGLRGAARAQGDRREAGTRQAHLGRRQ